MWDMPQHTLSMMNILCDKYVDFSDVFFFSEEQMHGALRNAIVDGNLDEIENVYKNACSALNAERERIAQIRAEPKPVKRQFSSTTRPSGGGQHLAA